MRTAPGEPPLPPGLPVCLDPRVRRLGPAGLLGGDPGRFLRLGPGGARALDALAAGRADGPQRALGRTLLTAGLAHPHPAPADLRTAVVVPVRDHPHDLDRCLTALGRVAELVVVDDASHDARGIAGVAHRHGARLVVRPVNGGPAAARNDGLAALAGDTDLVALLDSDCEPGPTWLADLAGHFADPCIGAVAPRVVGAGGPGLLARYGRARSPLDLGPDPAAVRPGGRVPYVPTAALVVRRGLLGDRPFDEALRFGEDVDLVWRLHDAGWTVRYDPAVEVGHHEPTTWAAAARRRFRYGTSAGPLALRHGDRLAPVVLRPWPTAVTALLVLGRPRTALVAAAVPVARLARTVCSPTAAAAVVAQGVLTTAAGSAAGPVPLGPLLALAAGRRRAALVLLVLGPLLDHRSRRPAMDPLRWTLVRLADDRAYGAGVVVGAWRGRTLRPLLPTTRRPT